MVTKISPLGLIVATRKEVTPPLDNVVRCCGWPLLLEATPRRLAHELALRKPECVLFWLEDRAALSPTERLVSWSRERGTRPHRVAVAYRMDANAEAVLRSAGAHSFLSISECSGDALADALWPLVESSARASPESAMARGPRLAAPPHERVPERSFDRVRPP
jgi:hypothetical protein